MKARLGIAPIAWSNDDLPELGGDTPLEVCLSESREAGFSGVETGGKFPKTPRELKEVLAAHDLKLVSGWYSGRVLENDLSAEKDRAQRSSSFSARTAQRSSSTARRPARCRTSATCRSRDAHGSTTSRCAPTAESSRHSPSIATTEGAALLPSPHGDGDRDRGRRRPADEFFRRSGGAALRHRPHHLRRRRRAPHGEAAWQPHQPCPREGHPHATCFESSIFRDQSFLDAVLARRVHGARRRHDRLQGGRRSCSPRSATRAGSWSRPSRTRRKRNPLKYAKIGHEAL